MFANFNIKQKDRIYLIFIVLFSAVLVGYYINFNDSIGISCSDVYIYLLNALYYTGTNVNSTDFIYLSPLICFLTSLFFQVGFVDKLAIYIVTGAFAVFGNIGFYLLLRKYFNENLSLTGAILYSSFSLCLTWLANGTLDIPATGMIIWIVLFTYVAIKENPKYYEYLMPLIVLGFFTRYTVILTLPALALFYVYEKGFKINYSDLRHIIKGVLIAAAIAIVILSTVTIMGHGQFEAKNQISHGIIGNIGSDSDPAFNPDPSYYLVNYPNFISNSHSVFNANPDLENPTILSWAIFAMLLIGAGLWLYDNNIRFEKTDIVPLAIFLIAILSFTRVSSVITTLLILIGLYLIGKDTDNKTGLFMLAWILCNAIFLSYYQIKVNRYIIPTFPPFIYFILLSIEYTNRHVKINENLIPILLILAFIIQAFAFTATFEPTDKYTSTEEMSNYIIENNPDYQNMKIGVYNLRPYCWWLGGNTTGIPVDSVDEIDKSNVTYYISNKKLDNLTNYTEIKNIDQLYLYENINV
ncbi:glycosyltransferase family 39 protein [Methanobrevibacter sp.]|uniref:glycosyltransferase family 39 protein n=1 Tax=Methanobrevibacter sp. TaxID=66852 RepID=UPI003865D537